MICILVVHSNFFQIPVPVASSARLAPVDVVQQMHPEQWEVLNEAKSTENLTNLGRQHYMENGNWCSSRFNIGGQPKQRIVAACSLESPRDRGMALQQEECSSCAIFEGFINATFFCIVCKSHSTSSEPKLLPTW